jgi:hypothetical protein
MRFCWGATIGMDGARPSALECDSAVGIVICVTALPPVIVLASESLRCRLPSGNRSRGLPRAHASDGRAARDRLLGGRREEMDNALHDTTLERWGRDSAPSCEPPLLGNEGGIGQKSLGRDSSPGRTRGACGFTPRPSIPGSKPGELRSDADRLHIGDE